jgi:hypothetical protein
LTVTKTIGRRADGTTSGRDYTSLQAWNDDRAATLSEPEVALLYNDGDPNLGTLAMVAADGWVTTPTNNVTIKAADASQEHQGVPNAGGVCIYSIVAGQPLLIEVDNVIVEGLEVFSDATNTQSDECQVTAVGCIFRRMFIHDIPDDSLDVDMNNTTGTGSFLMENSIIASYETAGSCLKLTTAGSITGTMKFMNCMLQGSGVGIEARQQQSSTFNLKVTNCAVYGGSVNCYAATGSVTIDSGTGYNWGDDATLPDGGTTNTDNATFTDSTAGGTNHYIIECVANGTAGFLRRYQSFFLVNHAQNDADTTGIGPSSDSDVPTTDIIGNTRSGTTCDPGPHEMTGETIVTTYSKARTGLTCTGTATGNIAIYARLGGMTPKGAWFQSNYADFLDDKMGDWCHSSGAHDGTNGWYKVSITQDQQGTMDIAAVEGTGDVIRLYTGDDALDMEVSFVRFVRNGVVLNVDDAPAAIRFISALFFAGADAACDAIDVDSGSPADDPIEVTCAFEPDFVLAARAQAAYSADTAQSGDRKLALGFAANPGDTGDAVQRGMLSFSADNPATTSDVGLKLDETNFQGVMDTDRSTSYLFKATNFNPTDPGFDIVNASSAVSHHIGCLAVKLGGAQYKVGTITTRSTTGEQAYTDPGFQPQCVVLLANLCPSTGFNYDNSKAGTVGFFVLTEDFQVIGTNSIEEDGLGTSDVNDFFFGPPTTRRIDLRLDGTEPPTTEDAAWLKEMTSTGFTLNHTDIANAEAKKWLYLAIEEDPAAAPAGPFPPWPERVNTLLRM